MLSIVSLAYVCLDPDSHYWPTVYQIGKFWHDYTNDHSLFLSSRIRPDWQIRKQHPCNLQRDNVARQVAGEHCTCGIPSLQLAMQRVARKEQSSTFRDVARQFAVCNIPTATCHAMLLSSLRDTLEEMLHRVTRPLDGWDDCDPSRRTTTEKGSLHWQEDAFHMTRN